MIRIVTANDHRPVQDPSCQTPRGIPQNEHRDDPDEETDDDGNDKKARRRIERNEGDHGGERHSPPLDPQLNSSSYSPHIGQKLDRLRQRHVDAVPAHDDVIDENLPGSFRDKDAGHDNTLAGDGRFKRRGGSAGHRGKVYKADRQEEDIEEKRDSKTR